MSTYVSEKSTQYFFSIVFFSLFFVSYLSVGNAFGDRTEFKVRVWLANEGMHASKVQICADVRETFASSCKSTYVSNEKHKVFDGGIFTFNSTSAPKNSTVAVCFYSFKYENGDCKEFINDQNEDVKNTVLFRINYSPVFYDKEDMRLYQYGPQYMSKSGLQFSTEHESISIPLDTKNK